MLSSSVPQALQSFAREQGLPQPELVEGADGRHAFLYSQDKARRYAYSLTWSDDQRHLLWVMLNPGTGETEGRRRNTFERCKMWSQSMGYGGMIFGNVFSLRTKSAKSLMALSHQHDELNERALRLLSKLAPSSIVAWGGHGEKSGRANVLSAVLSNSKCFGYTKTGQPRHPLYVAKNTPLVPWQGTAAKSGEA